MHFPRSIPRAALAALLGLSLAGAGVVAVAEPPPGGYAPDPAGRPSAKQWVFDVTYSKGRAWLTRARPVRLQRPASTARVMGRFAVELYIGKELLDRIRFDVPLTGDAPEKPTNRPFRRPTFDEGVTARLKVQMADNPRATYVKLVDRMTGAEQRLSWPPDASGLLTPMGQPAAAVRSDAGAGADAAAEGGSGSALPARDGGAPAPGDAGPEKGAPQG